MTTNLDSLAPKHRSNVTSGQSSTPNAYKYIAPRLSEMPRMVNIVYPRLPHEGPGVNVWSAPAHKILQHCSASEWPTSGTGLYLADLAYLLEEGASPPSHRVEVGTKEHRFFEEHGYFNEVSIEYPIDYPAPRSRHGDRATCLGTSAGGALSAIARELDASDPTEAARLRRIVESYFPDWGLEIEFLLLDGRSGWLRDFNRTRLERDPEEHLEPAIGSALVVHYGGGSRFSNDPEAYPYTVHPRFDLDEPDSPFGCFLVSESATLVGEMWFEGEFESL